jgi:hypothetical protein
MTKINLQNLVAEQKVGNEEIEVLDSEAQIKVFGGVAGETTTEIHLFDDGSAIWVTTYDFEWGFTTQSDAFSDFDSGQLLESSYTTTTYRA